VSFDFSPFGSEPSFDIPPLAGDEVQGRRQGGEPAEPCLEIGIGVPTYELELLTLLTFLTFILENFFFSTHHVLVKKWTLSPAIQFSFNNR